MRSRSVDPRTRARGPVPRFVACRQRARRASEGRHGFLSRGTPQRRRPVPDASRDHGRTSAWPDSRRRGAVPVGPARTTTCPRALGMSRLGRAVPRAGRASRQDRVTLRMDRTARARSPRTTMPLDGP